jgi:hypothetical protein
VAQADAVACCVSGLAAYLVAQIPSLNVEQEWPYGNEQLTYPTLTIFAGKAPLTQNPPYVVSQGTMNTSTGLIIANECMGSYDCVFQLDLWCRDKLQRQQYLDLILAAFDAQATDGSGNNNPAGLSLQLSSYFNEWARFDIQDHQHKDEEAAAQRKERREMINVLVNCRVIRQRTYYGIKSITVENEISTQEVDFSDDTTDTDSYTVPDSD